MDYKQTNFVCLLFIVVIVVLIAIVLWSSGDSENEHIYFETSKAAQKDISINQTLNTTQTNSNDQTINTTQTNSNDQTLNTTPIKTQTNTTNQYTLILNNKKLILSNATLQYLAQTMINNKIQLNTKIPLGYIFVMQLIADDIAFNQTKTPSLNLESLYNTANFNADYLELNTNINDTHNALLAQTKLIFVRFHNKLIDMGLNFEAAKTEVIQTYQYLVVKDFLFKFCTPKLVRKLLNRKTRLLSNSQIPLEFSMAAFRFAHSILPNEIMINDDLTLKMNDVFEKKIVDINWAKFFGSEAQYSRKIGPHINSTTQELALNLLKQGQQSGLTSGRKLSKYLGIRALTSKQLERHFKETKKYNLSNETPLWYYLLAESAIREKGEALGPVGAFLVAEVIIMILKNDTNSYLHTKEWKSKYKNFDSLCRYVFN